MEIFPNPVNVYAESMPVLFYYSELYNLERDTSRGNVVLINQLQNNYGEVIYSKEKNWTEAIRVCEAYLQITRINEKENRRMIEWVTKYRHTHNN